MSGMDVLNISVGVISLVLGGFAIWLSVYFFIKAKESEKETAKTLEAIRTQSDALQKLTGRWMDRFTRYATEPKPADEGLMMLVNTMANLPTTILTHLRVHTTTEPAPSNEALFGELTDCYIALYYYIAIANVSSQALLPDFDNFDSTAPVHTGIKLVVDQTASDFDYMARVLAGVNESRLKASRVRHLLEDAQKNWRPFVRNTEGSWSARKKSE